MKGHSAAVQLLIERGADIKAKSNPAPRGRGPALGKANDPRKAVAAQGAALAAGNPVSQILRETVGPTRRTRRTQRRRQRRRRWACGGRGAADRRPVRPATTDDDCRGGWIRSRRQAPNDGGGLTPLIYAARANDLESVKVLLDAGADINQTTGYGWSPLLVATQNRYYKLGAYLLERGAIPTSPTRADGFRSTPTDNRNIENGDYPVRKGDMDHLEFIKLLLDKGANVNARVKDSTETRTVFTNQWLDENGATAFLRASQSGDVELMKLLLSRGADPKINTVLNVSPLHVAAGIGWVEGITYEWSPRRRRRGEDADRARPRREPAGRHRPHRDARRRAQGPVRRRAGLFDKGRARRRQGLRQHRQPRRQARRAHQAAGGLRRRPRPRRRAVGDRPSGDRLLLRSS